MGKPRAGVVGGGVVGSAMVKLCGPDTVVYDPHRPEFANTRDQINQCDAVFVCVPTPMRADRTCDTTIVEESIAWIEAPLILIRSTVSPGTTERLSQKYGKHVVFQPEYLGETPAHIFATMGEREFVVLGGTLEARTRAADFYKHFYNAYVKFYLCDAVTAEVAKYMENAFYAVKVTFINEFYDIARAHGVDFNTLREVWLADTRISRDHTFCYPDARGFSGKCLPKDCNAIVKSSQSRGYEPEFMKACLKINEAFLAMNAKPAPKAMPERGLTREAEPSRAVPNPA